MLWRDEIVLTALYPLDIIRKRASQIPMLSLILCLVCTMKRGRPRARGRFGRIMKPFSELTIKVRQVEEQA